ncbi:hypothetical protein SAMN05216326_12517 [Nitrosomonas marina]|uniref:Uncharacterized protein n=1 Tax=Nitrosomonas marina TaxID=917 RepID=A0A1I0E607_9PROT|nr:hypothetical protein SAMN05216326_12517 [Nitrosomonas marina]
MIIGEMDVSEAIHSAIVKLHKKIDGFAFVETRCGNADVSGYIFTSNPLLLLRSEKITIIFNDRNGIARVSK